MKINSQWSLPPKLCAAAIACLILSGTLQAGEPDDRPVSVESTPLKLGILPGTGVEASSILEGAREAVFEMEGLSAPSNSCRLELHAAQPLGVWEGAAGGIARLIYEKGAMGLIGADGTSDAHLALQIATKARVPFITLATADSLTQANDPWVFRALPSAFVQTETLVRWARDRTVPPNQIHALIPDGKEGEAQRKALLEICGRLDVALEINPAAATEDACCLYLGTDLETAAINLKRHGNSGKIQMILAPMRLLCPVFLEAVSGLEIPVVFPWFKTGLEPLIVENHPDAYRAIAHDAVHWLWEAARGGQADAYETAERLRTGSYIGRTGNARFDAMGNRLTPLITLIWREGAWEVASLDD